MHNKIGCHAEVFGLMHADGILLPANLLLYSTGDL